MDSSNAFLNLFVNLVTLGVGWIVGQRVVTYWTTRQKRKELQLQLADQFYVHYGQFRSVWKSWNEILTDISVLPLTQQIRMEWLNRALKAEGGMEAWRQCF